MLINFTIGNSLSFRDKKTLSAEATSIKEHKERIIVKDKIKLLPSIAIYGANSSGKSNLINSIIIFKSIISNSLKKTSHESIEVAPFLLNNETENQPTFFEIEVLLEGSIFRYGFNVDEKIVHSEWLYQKKDGHGKERELFFREKGTIECSKHFEEGYQLENKVRENGLFLPVVDSFNGKTSQLLINYIDKLHAISGLEHEYFSLSTAEVCKIQSYREKLINLFRSLDLGFQNFVIPKEEDEIKKFKAYTIHNVYDNSGQPIGQRFFPMGLSESSGTNKVFDLATLILVSLELGTTLVIDELDSKLHPLITRKIIELFNNPETNTGQGMLIFTTHDTNLLSSKLLRRDQVWFTEKDKTEATDLYSLVEFKLPDGKSIRNDSSYEKDYIKGRYGAIPYIKD